MWRGGGADPGDCEPGGVFSVGRLGIGKGRKGTGGLAYGRAVVGAGRKADWWRGEGRQNGEAGRKYKKGMSMEEQGKRSWRSGKG